MSVSGNNFYIMKRKNVQGFRTPKGSEDTRKIIQNQELRNNYNLLMHINENRTNLKSGE